MFELMYKGNLIIPFELCISFITRKPKYGSIKKLQVTDLFQKCLQTHIQHVLVFVEEPTQTIFRFNVLTADL